MKKLLLLLVFSVTTTNAQIVNIPDANFKAKLLSITPHIDTNNDNEIQVSEAALVLQLEIANANISNLTGIEYFTNLYNLYCYNNQLTSLNIVSLSNLMILNCSNNQISSLNIASLSNLRTLDCSNNQISSLNLPVLLNTLDCYDNLLTSIDFSNNTNLHFFNGNNNLLANLNVSGLPLNDLRCSNNELSSINIENCSALNSLQIDNNQLSSLDISTIHTNMSINIYNNPLISLFLKNGYSEYINFGLIPNLEYICADEQDVSDYENLNPLSLFPNLVVNSYCSFVPGGTFYTVQGNAKFDDENNGCDATDMEIPHVKFNITNGSLIGQIYSDESGNFHLPIQSGNYTITPSIENQNYFIISPSQINVSFPSQGSPFNQNFCLGLNGVHNDLEVIIVPIGNARPGFDSYYQIIYKNKGNQVLSGIVNFTFDDSILEYIPSIVSPDAQTTGNLSWNYTNLMPFESRNLFVMFHVNAPTDSPAVNIGEQLNFTATINPTLGDDLPLDNIFAINQTVVGSYDPNDKTCLEGTTVSSSKIGDYLHYTINFENTGTSDATFVVVKDIIDNAKFDINSLQILYSSHPMTTRVSGNIVEFIFDNINLAGSQHGNVVFKIKTKSTLVTGNTVTNNANIYFDYNAPILTNTVTTTFLALNNGQFAIDNSIVVSPNPTNGSLFVVSDVIVKSIQLFDAHGRLLETKLTNDSSEIIDISEKSNGIYFLKINSELGSKVEKIVKK